MKLKIKESFGYMEIIKLVGAFVAAAIMLTSCNGGSTPLGGPTTTTRGDDPVRGTNIINYCETTNTKSTSTVINNTNNCTKNNTTSTGTEGTE